MSKNKKITNKNNANKPLESAILDINIKMKSKVPCNKTGTRILIKM